MGQILAKGLEVTGLGTHTGLVIMPVPTTQNGNDHVSWDTEMSTQKGPAPLEGNN